MRCAEVSYDAVHQAEELKKAWRDKAQRLIANACMAEWKKANIIPSGKKRKHHVPYCIPKFAQALVECLNDNDEERAKALFLSYDGMRLL